MSFVKRRLAAIGLSGCILALNSCVQENLRDWGHAEVTVKGATWHAHEWLWSVVLDVKNVVGVEDGEYLVAIQDVRVIPPSHVGPDGILELDERKIGTLERRGPIPWSDPWENYWESYWSGNLMQLDTKALKNPDLATLMPEAKDRGSNWPPTFATMLQVSQAHDYVLEVFAFDEKQEQWVRLGRLPIGQGTQSPWLRTTAVVCALPVAWAIDIILLPIYLVRNQTSWGCCLGPIPL